MKINIEKVRYRKACIKNDGTTEELRQAITLCFPNNSSFLAGSDVYYYASKKYPGDWISSSDHKVGEVISVKDFFKFNPKFGDEVIVNDGGDIWYKRTYIATLPGKPNYSFIVTSLNPSDVLAGVAYDILPYKFMKPVEKPKKTELTVKEIEKLLGLDALHIIKE